jgi:hypothetical protein
MSSRIPDSIRAFPYPLNRRVDGPLIRYVTGYKGSDWDYDFDDLAESSSKAMTQVSLPSKIVFTHI